MYREILVAAFFCLAAVYSYSAGGPPSACTTLTPNHGVQPKSNEQGQFYVQLWNETMSSGESIPVSLYGKEKTKFKGFFIVARNEENANIGKMDVYYDYSTPYVTARCDGKGLTHAKKWQERPWHELDFVWTAPADFTGKVKFFATAVKDKATFWVGLEGNMEVTVSAPGQNTTTTTTEQPPTVDATETETTTQAPAEVKPEEESIVEEVAEEESEGSDIPQEDEGDTLDSPTSPSNSTLDDHDHSVHLGPRESRGNGASMLRMSVMGIVTSIATLIIVRMVQRCLFG